MMRPRKYLSGFTLIELLIAGAISAMLLSALFALLFGTLRLRDTAYRTTETGAPREQVASLLRRDLLGAVAPSGILAGTFLGQAGTGMRTEGAMLTFYTTSGVVSENLPWGDVQAVAYTLEDPLDGNTDAGLDLVRRVTRNLLSTTVDEETDDAPNHLLGGIATMTLEFWDGDAWQEEWDSTANDNKNPKAVRIRLEFEAKSDTELPPEPLEIECELTTQPRTAATATASPGSSSGSGTSGSGANSGGSTTPSAPAPPPAPAGGGLP